MSLDHESDHTVVVSAWVDRCTRGAGPPELLDALERAFRAVWERARQTLGDPTLTAIVDRVLCTAADAHPVLGPISAEGGRLVLDPLRERSHDLARDEVVGGARFVLAELLRVIGNLTADILTPALHAALSNVPPSDDADGEP